MYFALVTIATNATCGVELHQLVFLSPPPKVFSPNPEQHPLLCCIMSLFVSFSQSISAPTTPTISFDPPPLFDQQNPHRPPPGAILYVSFFPFPSSSSVSPSPLSSSPTSPAYTGWEGGECLWVPFPFFLSRRYHLRGWRARKKGRGGGRGSGLGEKTAAVLEYYTGRTVCGGKKRRL